MPELIEEYNLAADPSDGSQGNWENYQAVTTFPTDAGLMILPVAGPDGTPPVIVKTHAKLAFKSVTWQAMKSGKPPDVPCPEEADSNEVMISTSLSPATPQLMVNQLGYVWTMAGTYNYVLLNPLNPGSRGLPGSANPMSTTPASNLNYPAVNFRDDLLQGTDSFTE